jgi:hypothetical protein
MEFPRNPELLDEARERFAEVVERRFFGVALAVRPTPGRSWACAHHTPSSSRSTTTGTVTVMVRDPATTPR